MKVAINMATSIDGKIATKERGPVKLGSSFDTKRMSEIRAAHDVVINGASTFKAYPFPLHVAGLPLRKQPVTAFVSSRLDFPKNTPWERATGAKRWVFCGNRASAKRIEELRTKGIIVVQSKKLRPSAEEILKSFAKAKLNRVLLEGGGEFNASFLEQDLVNKIHLTLCPIVVGGAEAPTFVEGAGFSKKDFLRFRLKRCEKKGHELYLVYER